MKRILNANIFNLKLRNKLNFNTALRKLTNFQFHSFTTNNPIKNFKMKYTNNSLTNEIVKQFDSYISTKQIQHCLLFIDKLSIELMQAKELIECEKLLITLKSELKSNEHSNEYISINLNVVLSRVNELMGNLHRSESLIKENIEFLNKKIKSDDDINYLAYLCLMNAHLHYLKVKTNTLDSNEYDKNFLSIYQKLKPNLNYILSYVQIILAKLFEHSNINESIFILKSLHNQLENKEVDLDDKICHMLAMKLLAKCFVTNSNLKESLNFIDKSSELFEKLLELEPNLKQFVNFEYMYTELFNLYENLYMQLFNHADIENAITCFDKADKYLKNLEITEDQEKQIIFRPLNKARLLEEMNKFNESISVYENFKNKLTENKSNLNMSESDFEHYLISCDIQIGNNYINLKKFEDAKTIFINLEHKIKQNWEILKDDLNPLKMVDIIYKIAEGNQNIENYPSSLDSFQWIINYYNELGADERAHLTEFTLQSLFHKAEILFKLDEYEESKQTILDLFHLIREKHIKVSEDKYKSLYSFMMEVEAKQKDNI